MYAARSITAVVVLLAWSFVVQGQQHRTESCRVEFTDPKSGDSVPNEGDVKGTATIPPGTHLWIFAHRRGLALWWPQGGGPAQIDKQEWMVFVTYGQDRDRGSQFEVAAVVLEEKDHEDMLNVIKRYEGGQYAGVQMPPPARDCSIPKMIVTKR
jgi:hypothetical protein